jgi:hypothetical protein
VALRDVVNVSGDTNARRQPALVICHDVVLHSLLDQVFGCHVVVVGGRVRGRDGLRVVVGRPARRRSSASGWWPTASVTGGRSSAPIVAAGRDRERDNAEGKD